MCLSAFFDDAENSMPSYSFYDEIHFLYQTEVLKRGLKGSSLDKSRLAAIIRRYVRWN